MSESLGVTSVEYKADNLFADDHPPVQIPATIVSGAGKLTRGTVLGKITKAVGTIVASEDNTGDAAIPAVTLAKNAQVGAYTVKCITAPSEASANDAKFAVFTPDGARLADATQHVAYAGGHIVFTISNATAADSAVGDLYTINVTGGSAKFKAYDSDNTDGTEVARAILTRDIDATSADAVVTVFAHGVFNKSELTGIDDAGIVKLQEFGIFVKEAK